MAQKFYAEQFKIQNTDVDFCGRMKPGALLRYVEQVSAEHARAEGHGEDFLHPQGLALLVGRQSLRFARVPRRGERLTLTTYPEQSRHASMKRITAAVDEQGRQVALVDARWILVDMRQGRILREPTWDTSPFWAQHVEAELPQSVHRAEAGAPQPAGMRYAGYSLCDENGHVNNAVYLDLACDALPLEELRRNSIVFASVKYNREVPLGEELSLRRARAGEGWYIAGQRAGKTAFECYLELKENDEPL